MFRFGLSNHNSNLKFPLSTDWRAPMTDEAEGARARRAPAPPPRQSSRPPEPRPRTQLTDPAALLPAPPRLIRPSEHLAIVERSMEERRQAQLSPDRREHPENRRPIQSHDVIQRSMERRPTQDFTIAERRPQECLALVERTDRRPVMQNPDNLVAERMERRPPHLMPAVTVLQGPRPALPPPVPVHRSVAPPTPRMPAPVPQPMMRLPQSRRDAQVSQA